MRRRVSTLIGRLIQWYVMNDGVVVDGGIDKTIVDDVVMI
jgi:hypothetical protein